MMTMRLPPPHLLLPILLALAPATTALAQNQADANWEQLSTAERDLLTQPLRERWNNANAEQRQRMLAHAQRWRDMPPEERSRARRGHDRFDRLNPEQQEQMRVLYEKTRDMSHPERKQTLVLFHVMRPMTSTEREALRREWATMTPEQRQAWVRENAPRRDQPAAPAKP